MVDKKLIEVALPLEAINEEGSRRKRKAPGGYPTMLHKWWAQRPIAAARAVVFSQMVDDPSGYVDELLADAGARAKAQSEFDKRLKEHRAKLELADGQDMVEPEPTLESVAEDIERDRLFALIEDLVKWENTSNEAVLEAARAEIRRSWRRTCARNADHPCAAELFDPDKVPAFHDPFAGSGAIPLEAQRLGLESYASDLNPVAVLINKAMIEIPPKFAGLPPVNPAARDDSRLFERDWKGAQGMAEDLRYYGQWMRDEAEKRIGHLHPKVKITPETVAERPDLKQYEGRELSVVAWVWARTVKSPNPAFRGVDVPLVSTFMLSTKAGKEAYVEPVIQESSYRFMVRVGAPRDSAAVKSGTSAGKRAAFKCIISGTPLPYDYIRSEGQAGRMGTKMMAIVAEGDRGRIYLTPTAEHEAAALKARPEWKPETQLHGKCRVNVSNYGLDTCGDLFTPRQLLTLTTFSDLVTEARERIFHDAFASDTAISAPDSSKSLGDGGTGAAAYSEAISIFLAMAVSRLADYGSSIATWRPKDSAMRSTMPKQAIQMAWDFAEGSAFGSSSAGFRECVQVVANVMDAALAGNSAGRARQADVRDEWEGNARKASISTDPPYYDNIGYADLSDFFYVWLRRSLRSVFPDLFATLAVPKSDELVATPYRHGSRQNAESFFLTGMTQAMHRLTDQTHPAFPVTIYYAFKQLESKGGTAAAGTGWETFLDAVIRAGLGITGTWPMRTEGDNRSIGIGSNALASSIVLVCRARDPDAATATRREFVSALKSELPAALQHLQRGNIAPVDLAQAAIGPGMAVFTRYAKVLNANGESLSVREALALINQILDEVLAEQEGDFDADSRWALTWFEENAFAEGEYGRANQLAQAKNTSVDGLVQAGILRSGHGKVQLLKPDELSPEWDPRADPRLTAWEMVHHLVRVLNTGGESAAAELVAKLGAKAEVARELCYRLFNLCERNKRANEALAYNALVQSWPEIQRLAGEVRLPASPEQAALL